MRAWTKTQSAEGPPPPSALAPTGRPVAGEAGTEEAGGLFLPGVTVWRVEDAARASVLVDAATYYGALRKALAKAEHSITIVGWDVDSRTRLVDETGEVDDGLPETLGAFLSALVRRRPGLRVRILLWDYSLLYALEREFVMAIGLQWTISRNIEVCLDDTLPVGCSQHQKVVVIDDAVAFSGGLDLTIRRWDAPRHQPGDPLRVDPAGQPYRPFHDVQMVVDGAAARALSDLVRQRWRAAALEGLPLSPRPTGDPWPEGLAPDLTDVRVGIARTVPGVEGEEPAVAEVEDLFAAMIDAAERFLYIENQFMTAASIAHRIAARMVAEPKLEVVLVAPRTHHTWIEHRTMLAGRIRFKGILDAADVGARLRLVYPEVGVGAARVDVMIHSKVTIVDDRVLRIGSANLCNRSFGTDTECDLAVEAWTAAERAAIAAVRDRFLGEHCGVPAAEFAAVMAETGSMIAAIDRCCSDERGLRPIDDGSLGADDPPAGIEMIADPPRPILPADFLADFDGGRTKPRRLRRYLAVAAASLALAALVLAWRYTPLATMTDPSRVADYLLGLGNVAWGYPVVVGIFVAAGLVAFPVTVLIGATAAAFGLWPGILYAATGAMASALVTYGIGRTTGAGPLRRLIGPRLNRIRNQVSQHGILAVATIRLVPLAPFTVINLVAGASRIRLVDYVAGTALGLAPGIAVMASLGESIASAIADPTVQGIAQIVLLIIGWIGLSLGFQALIRRMRKRARPT